MDQSALASIHVGMHAIELAACMRGCHWHASMPYLGIPTCPNMVALHACCQGRHAIHYDCSNDISTCMTIARTWAAVAIYIGPRLESIGELAVAVPHLTGAVYANFYSSI